MKNTLQICLEHTYSYVVPENKTVPFLYPEDKHFSRMPKVFATGYMVGLIEITCMQSLSEHLEEGEGSVGTHIAISHISPTPPGMSVEIRVKVVEIDGNRIVWEVTARDEKDIIGKGKHQRHVVNWERFNSKINSKRANRK